MEKIDFEMNKKRGGSMNVVQPIRDKEKQENKRDSHYAMGYW